MKPIDEELRERAEWLRKNPERWIQGNPPVRYQCLLFKGVMMNDMDARRVVSKAAEEYLERFLYGYLLAKGHDLAEDIRINRVVAVTGYNDMIATCVEDVIEMLEKAAAEYHA